MATNQALTPSTEPNLSFNLMQVLSEPWVDRTIAAIACIPLVYGAYYRMQHFHLGLPLIGGVVNTLILVVTMVIRRPPRRITPNPWYWLLAFVASYWLVFIIFFLQKGRPVVASWITDSLATLGLAIVVWARLNLGRNIGLVPAQRELVQTGAYALMRHPVYTGVLFVHTALVVRAYSPLNLLLLGMGVLWFIPIKSLVEEDFLCADPEYASYMQKVRARWIPFVI